MTITEAKKRFAGFTRWHNRIVKPELKCKRATLWQIYIEDLMNTGAIEITRDEAKDGNPHLWT